MSKYYCDMHIHTCLSPCADDDMTPMNIVAMANLIGLDIIAVTDHNSALNVRAICEAAIALGGPLVMPGMELETEEGIHTIILFPSCDKAEEATKELIKLKLSVPNDERYYGKQLIVSANDEITGNEPDLLIIPTALPLYGVKEFAERFGAAAYPAHILREENGIISVLGGVDRDMGFEAVETGSPLSLGDRASIFESTVMDCKNKGFKLITGSDAHSLHQIAEKENFLELKELSIEAVLDFIKEK